MLVSTTSAESPAVPQVPKKTSWTVQEVKDMTNQYADAYKVSRSTMNAVVSCESGYDYLATGDSGHSIGVSQIHGPSHPEITKDQALDPDFALDFMAKSIASGKGRMWTCYRNIYK